MVAGCVGMHNGWLILLLCACVFGRLRVSYRAGNLGLQVMAAVDGMHGSNVRFFVEKVRKGIAGNRHCAPRHEYAIKQK